MASNAGASAKSYKYGILDPCAGFFHHLALQGLAK